MSQTALKSPFEPVPESTEVAPNEPVLETVKRIRKLQELIQRAVAAGDMSALQKFTQEMNQEMQKSGVLAGAVSPEQSPAAVLSLVPPVVVPQAVAPAPVQTPRVPSGMYEQGRAQVALDLLVYDGDRDVLANLLLDPVVLEAIERETARRKSIQGPSLRGDLLKKCLHLTARLAPRLYGLLEDCRSVIGLKGEVELYIEESAQRNACVYSPDGETKMYIVLTSALVESFDEGELRFIIGHEIGHHLFDHRQVPVLSLLEHQGGMISPIKRMKLFSWKRNAEISCDRVGMLCARSQEASLRALFKLSSGIHARMDAFDIGEYALQFGELQREVEKGVADPSDWYTTHPFNPVRIQAMQLFHRSATYRDLTQDTSSPADIGEQELEQRVAQVLKVMDPVLLQEEGKTPEAFRQFLLWAGLDLAALDGTVSQDEVEVMATLVPAPPSFEAVNQYLGLPHEERWKKVMEVGNLAVVHASILDRMNLIRDLCVLAASDHKVDERELQVLLVHARAMEVGEQHVYTVLEGLKKPLD